MKLSQAISLIRHPLITNQVKSKWADFGCGTGLFTNALATLLHPGSKIYAVDSDPSRFRQIKSTTISFDTLKVDFARDDLNLDDLDGILMANSLHFVKEKTPFIQKIRKYLNTHGKFIIVEYDMDSANPWVPYPVSYPSLKNLFEQLLCKSLTKIHETPSLYNRAGIYSAIVEC